LAKQNRGYRASQPKGNRLRQLAGIEVRQVSTRVPASLGRVGLCMI
jgi:hypothetical protein